MTQIHSALKPIHSKGFTLIELLISVIILSVALASGIPSFQRYIQRSQTNSSSYQLIADVNFARSEAVMRSRNVSIIGSGGDWNGGWVVEIDDNLDGIADSANQTLRSTPESAEGYEWGSAGTTFISFDATGQLFIGGVQALAPYTFSLCGPGGGADLDQNRRINIVVTGRSEMLTGGASC